MKASPGTVSTQHKLIKTKPVTARTTNKSGRTNSATAITPRRNSVVLPSRLIQTPFKKRSAYIFDVPSLYNSLDVVELAKETLGNRAYFKIVKLVRGGASTSDWVCELEACQFRDLKENIKLASKLYRIRIKDTDNIMAAYYNISRCCMRCGSNIHRVQLCPKPKRRKGQTNAAQLRQGRPAPQCGAG